MYTFRRKISHFILAAILGVGGISGLLMPGGSLAYAAAPVANGDTATVEEDSGANAINVLANDSDVDGDALTIIAVTQSVHGTVAITGGGTGLTYTPNENYVGSDSLTYTVHDGNGGTSTATVNVTVTGVNDGPSAGGDTATVEEDSGANAINVLANDSDVDGDTLTIIAVTQSLHGTVAITGGGTGLTYTPNENYVGSDSLTYTVHDGNGGTSTATVTVTVTGVNDGPSAGGDTTTVEEDSGANAINVLANDSDIDGDTLTIIAVTQSAHGLVEITEGGTGLTYTPDTNFNGPDSFTYTVSDHNGGTSTATVNVTVTGVNDGPSAGGDTATVEEDSGANAINVLANDSDVDGDTLTIIAVTQSAHGLVEITEGGTGLTYTPDTNYNGPDSFTYTVNDNHGGTSTSTVTLTVNSVNDTPTANDDPVTVEEDSRANAIDVLANDSDLEGDSLSIIEVTDGAHGKAVVTGNGKSVEYTPAADYSGLDTFTYKVSDGHGGSATATVRITIDKLSYTIAPLADLRLTDLNAGYLPGSQQTQTVTVSRKGTGPLKNMSVALSGTNAADFTVTQPVHGTLDSATPTTAFTVKGKDGLAAGTHTATVTVSATKMTPVTFSVTQVVYNRPSNSPGGSGTPPSDGPKNTTKPTKSDAQTLVNGKAESVGTATTTTVNGRTVTTVTVDPAKVQPKLESSEKGTVITIQGDANADVVIGELNGQLIQDLAQNQAVIVIQSKDGSYSLPLERISMDSLAKPFGTDVQLQDVQLLIEMSKPTAETEKLVAYSAVQGEFTIVAPPLEFKVSGVSGGRKFELTRFEGYVERTIALPADADPSKVTTALVIEPDGKTRQVPTKIVEIDGKYHAKMSSLTNSIYAVVWHPVDFQDVARHWAKDAVNDMGSRMIVSGVGDGRFGPDQHITRAEFAAMIIRALGLKTVNGSIPFTDIAASDWYRDAIQTAYAYGFIGGFPDGTFRPLDAISREQAMAMLVKAMEITGLQAKLQAGGEARLLESYADVGELSEWARPSMSAGLQAGIVSGRTATLLAPKGMITRAEAAVIVRRMLQESGLI
ncbi:Ig-like domain-containing protein [Cohnella sp. CFH 77786]|uniref:Ig-like domain-containing protein n=1 Tax=Cohnella sp. CFH 77786 TaxID=2662265 RepID=UPI001C60AB40|nr:Ig-like domain-containing protein [Cohnella sp. CFH 77786]